MVVLYSDGSCILTNSFIINPAIAVLAKELLIV